MENYRLLTHLLRANLRNISLSAQIFIGGYQVESRLRFELPEASDIHLTIHDVNGRLIQELNGYYSQGLHEVRFGRGEMGQYSGL